MSAKTTIRYSAGIYEQCRGGWSRHQWSHHRTSAAAERAAKRYACQETATAGGAYTWSAWWHDPINEQVHTVGSNR